MSLFDDVKKNLVEWYSVTSEKTSEVAKVTSRRYDKFGISRDIERQFSELGSLVYNGLTEEREDLLLDPALVVLVERIKELETELNDKDEEIETIRREYSSRRTTKPSAGVVDEAVLKDPALQPGAEDSAILVEPTEGDDPALEVESVEVDIVIEEDGSAEKGG